jgi:hypothetical protein
MQRALAIVSISLVAACATPATLTGRTEAELNAKMGPPSGQYPNSDGSRILAYSMGRLGTETYMADVSPAGQVIAVRGARNDDTFQRIVQGMHRDEVLRMIGPPGDTMRFPRQNQDSWEYYYQDTWGYPAYFYVNFDASGIVVSKVTRRIDGRDSGGHR